MCTAFDYLPLPESPSGAREAGITYAKDVFNLLRSVLAAREVFQDAQYKTITDPLLNKIAPKLLGLLDRSVANLPEVGTVRSEYATMQEMMLKSMAAKPAAKAAAAKRTGTKKRSA